MENYENAVDAFKASMYKKISKSHSTLTESEIQDKVNIALEEQINLEDLANRNCLLRVVAGSNAYGTNLPTSDWDERGIFVDDMMRTILPFEKLEQVTFMADDIVYFELSKYMPLLLAQNPNVIELLWTAPQDLLFVSDIGQILIDNRHNFLSSKVKDSYVGYATGQLKRIKGHNHWLNKPQPVEEPQQKDFMSVILNLSSNIELNKKIPLEGYIAMSLGDNHFSLWDIKKLNIQENLGWIDQQGKPAPLLKQNIDQLNPHGLLPDILVKVNSKSFEDAHNNWKAYWNWKENRNEKRSELEALHGYDTKHAMHLIRLLRSGIDILETGVVPVKREDAAYLLDIRNGVYTYEEIVKESERLAERVNILSKTTNLPAEPDYNFAKSIMLEIYQKQWGMPLSKSKRFNL